MQVKKVLVIGASGNLGRPVVSQLLKGGYNVTALTREGRPDDSQADLTLRTDYSADSLRKAFQDQDVVVSATSTFSTDQQHRLIDAAIAAGVKRFLPSDYGFDTSDDEVVGLVPPALSKVDTIAYLRAKESLDLSWTSVSCGALFDWALRRPGHLGWNIPARTATIFDGGDVPLEFTNLEQVGRAVAAVLSPKHYDSTANTYVYINSFTATQNQILGHLERLTGEGFTITRTTAQELAQHGLQLLLQTREQGLNGSESYPPGAIEVITAGIHGYGGFNQFSQTKGLWNKALELPDDDLEKTLRSIVN